MSPRRFSNEFTRAVFLWLSTPGDPPGAGLDEARALYEKHREAPSRIPFHRALEKAFLTGLASRLSQLRAVHPLAIHLGLLAADRIHWEQLADALIPLLEKSAPHPKVLVGPSSDRHL